MRTFNVDGYRQFIVPHGCSSQSERKDQTPAVSLAASCMAGR